MRKTFLGLFLVVAMTSATHAAESQSDINKHWIFKKNDKGMTFLSRYKPPKPGTSKIDSEAMIQMVSFKRDPQKTEQELLSGEVDEIKNQLALDKAGLKILHKDLHGKNLNCLTYHVLGAKNQPPKSLTHVNQCLLFAKEIMVINTLTVFYPGHDEEMLKDQLRILDDMAQRLK